MDVASILLVLLVAGVNYGWQPASDGSAGYDYVVQVEPELIDELHAGRAVPIESNIPPEVQPIRKVSLVVGRGEVARSPAEPINRTAYFAGQGGWPNQSTSPPPAANDRYAQQPAAGSSSVGPPPTFTSGSPSAGQQLQDWSNEAGRQLQSAGNNLRSAAEQTFNTTRNQLQQLTPSGSTSTQSSAKSATARSAVAPPPGWSSDSTTAAPQVDRTTSPGMAPRQTDTGWTSIGTSIAPPPLLIPQLPPASNRFAQLPQNSGNGTSSSSTASTTNTSNRSLLSNNTAQSAQSQSAARNPADDDWTSGWTNDAPGTGATISGNNGGSRSGSNLSNNSRNNDLVPLPTNSTRQSNSQQPASTGWDGWDNTNSWTGQPQQAQGPSVLAGPTNNPTQPTTPAGNQPGQGSPVLGPAQGGAVLTPAGGTPSTQSNIVQPVAANLPAKAEKSADSAWLTLAVVILSLVGSLSANVFLGLSYVDARQKYQGLVRRTADSFRRATTAAA